MLQVDYLKQYLQEFVEELDIEDAEILLFGGAAIAFKFGGRDTTKDIDAAFGDISEAVLVSPINKVAAKHGIDSDWLNNQGERFITPAMLDSREPLFKIGKVSFSTPSAEAMLAMKICAMRLSPDFKDLDDIKLLVSATGIADLQDVSAILSHYCPERAGETLSNPAKMIVLEKVLEEVSRWTENIDEVSKRFNSWIKPGTPPLINTREVYNQRKPRI